MFGGRYCEKVNFLESVVLVKSMLTEIPVGLGMVI